MKDVEHPALWRGVSGSSLLNGVQVADVGQVDVVSPSHLFTVSPTATVATAVVTCFERPDTIKG